MYRDRIKEFRRVKASELEPHPLNPKTHPIAQIEALRGSFAEFGICDLFVAFEPEPGRLQLVDGHGRTDIAGDQEVPTVILDITAEEAKMLVAVTGQTALLADWDDAKIADIVTAYKADDADLAHFLDGLKLFDPDGDDALPEADNGPDEMDLRPHEHYDYVMVLARTTHEWNRLCELLSLPAISVGRGSLKKIGIGRAIAASKVIEKLEGENGNCTF